MKNYEWGLSGPEEPMTTPYPIVPGGKFAEELMGEMGHGSGPTPQYLTGVSRMSNLDFEHRLTEGQFQNVVSLIRHKGGTMDHKIIEFEGVRAGYAMIGNLMKIHVEDTAKTREMTDMPLLNVIGEAMRIPVASYAVYPPAPLEPELVEESQPLPVKPPEPNFTGSVTDGDEEYHFENGVLVGSKNLEPLPEDHQIKAVEQPQTPVIVDEHGEPIESENDHHEG